MAGFLNAIIGSAFASGVGDYESIAGTVIVGSGGQASVEFSSIPATFKHLQIRWIGRCDAATTEQDMQLNVNNDTGNNYSGHYLFGNGSSLIPGGVPGIVNGVIVGRTTGANSTASIMGAAIIDILDYASGTKYPTFRVISGNDQNGLGQSFLGSGHWRNTTAITSIQLKLFSSGNWTTNSHFALYGIK